VRSDSASQCGCLESWRVPRLAFVTGLVAVSVAGCVTVNPDRDYQRAAGLIVERTGADYVYDPQAEDLIEEKVTSALADGLTIDEAIAVALLNNRAFQCAFREIGVSRADVVESGLISNPTLGLSLRFPEGGGLANLTLSLAQQLVDLWQIPVRKRIAEAQLERTLLLVAREAVL